MKSFKKLLSVLFLISIVNITYAQIIISGEIRPRTEYLHGFSTLSNPGEDPAFFTLQRSRLNFNYTSEFYIVKLVFQDVRTWGNTATMNVSDPFSSIHEAWGEALVSDKFSVKFGRQEISLDDQRIFGAVGWAQQARSHDAMLFKYTAEGFKGEIGLAYNQDAPLKVDAITSISSYKTLQYLWLNKSFSENASGSFLFLNNGKELDLGGGEYRVKFTQTLGTYIKMNGTPLSAQFAAYYQGGEMNNGFDTKVSAYNLALSTAYQVTEKYKIGAGIEVLSGNDLVNPDTKNKAFTPFYGTNHKFNGLMDYFYVGNHMNSVGLNDFYFTNNLKFEKISFNADLHFFMANQDLDSNFSNYLGSELDLTGKFKLTEGVGVDFGYSKMFGTNTMEVLKGGDKSRPNQWIWFMVTFKPEFYNSAKESE